MPIEKSVGKLILLIFLGFLIIASLFILRDNKDIKNPDYLFLDIKGTEFKLQMALDDNAREKGLSGVEFLPKNEGMIFIYPKPTRVSYWMYECLIDIDIIFLDCNGKVLNAEKMNMEVPRVPNEGINNYKERLPLYDSDGETCFVIELAAGSIDRLNIKRDEKIIVDYDSLIYNVKDRMFKNK
jgi:uncharacterized protein